MFNRFLIAILVFISFILLGAKKVGYEPKNFFFEIQAGRQQGISYELVRGFNPDVDSLAEEDVWGNGGTLSRLSAAETMNIVSSSTHDDSGQQGATAVLIKGVDNNGDAVQEAVVMDGTTNAATTNSYKYVNSMIVTSAGTFLHNVGTITATASSAGTVQASIQAEASLSEDSHYVVPNGFKAYLIKVALNLVKNTGGQSLIVRFKGVGLQDGIEYRLFDKRLDSAVTSELDVNVPIYSSFAAGTQITMRAATDRDDTIIKTRMYLVLEEL